MVHNLATQWIQSYPCKTKFSQEPQRSLQKFLESNRKPKTIYTDNFLEFGKTCEDLSCNHCTTPHRSETHGIAERAVRRVKKAPLQCCCKQVWMKSGGLVPWNAVPICETFRISCLMGKLHTKDVSENLAKDPFLLVHWLVWGGREEGRRRRGGGGADVELDARLGSVGAPNWSGRRPRHPGSQRPDGWRPKNAAKCSKLPIADNMPTMHSCNCAYLSAATGMSTDSGDELNQWHQWTILCLFGRLSLNSLSVCVRLQFERNPICT